MTHPSVNRDVVFYKSPTEVWAATITEVPEPLTSDLRVGLAIYPPPTVGSSIQGRDRVAYGPGVPGCWGWDEHGRYAAAMALSGHRVVTVDQDSQLIYADNRIPEHAHRVVGLIASAVSQGEMPEIINWQVVTEPSWNWEPGRSLLLGINGTMTQDYQAVRNSGGFTLIVGEAISPQSIFFAPKMPTMRI